MTTVLVLDSEALSQLARGKGTRFREVRAAVEAAARLGRAVVVPAVTLAELYRSPKENQLIDSLLNREPGFVVKETDRSFARLVGGVLWAARSGSGHLADAHTVAAAVDAGGGVILTGDFDDLQRLSASFPNVTVVRV